MKTVGYAAHDSEKPLEPYHFERRALRDEDVSIEILYCGVCHSDLHTAENDWGWTQYPVVPGHEIVGRVLEVGSGVTKYKVGDNVAVGCMVDSCLSCDQCHHGEEQFCREGMVGTYSGQDRISGELTQGGYSKHIVVREEFVLSVPEGLDLAKCAPILCAGITTYSPLRTWNVGPGSRVGVIGLGGLGHMAIKIAAAMGAHVTAISRSDKKKQQVLSYGAKDLLVSSDEAAMQAHANQFDVIINTIPVKHDFTPYIPLLDIDGTQVLVGQVGELAESNSVPLLMGRRRVAGSLIGGIAQTQEILDFCALHNILPEVEMIKMDQINDAFDKLKQGDMASRFVIDMSSLEV
ncbi:MULTISPECIES: NAD(P)-dependent alcohol dehydrogenase [unclassified Pseudoalteromonas]|uniref:NAD(P)-dependent alcohol dehydrogenase n=1 Tax=unclassified Pseudoalteromonas TaxID=194690 RepID=UPI00110A48EF|nr:MULTISPECIES: NAD(P)-dependent alcohol dehydrogenase [unclassified Pseudoalteromonas]MCF2915000.1 NAD(P)-dependent alcohol dehydrogenase [Pseudoalteromonas sp. Cn5-37]TMP21691.1 hydroxyacid dehydrogenase [Pseudoalteromonas sp. S2721]TMP48144.1 hydroxyacid dehydrogenase [Pseudoalteromonas sp. S1650]TMP66356.1 hydroxyacid dehydrogenase [Pseudoalteromonas sp. S1649]